MGNMQGLAKNLKMARDYAEYGGYQDTTFYYESILSKINQLGK